MVHGIGLPLKLGADPTGWHIKALFWPAGSGGWVLMAYAQPFAKRIGRVCQLIGKQKQAAGRSL